MKTPPQESQITEPRRKSADIRFPFYSLADSLLVAKAIHEKGGGTANRDQLAAFLDYSTTNSGAFLSRIAAARLFDFITTEGSRFVITPLAEKVLMPVNPPEDTQGGLVDAFLNVPLFKAVFDEYKGKELPPEFGLKNLMRTKFGIVGRNVALAYRVLMDSADQAGFFATRGTKTHLIIPTAAKQPALATANIESAMGELTERRFGGGRDDGTPPPKPTDPDQVKLEYVRKLIALLDSNTEVDRKELMDRIERLLGATP